MERQEHRLRAEASHGRRAVPTRRPAGSEAAAMAVRTRSFACPGPRSRRRTAPGRRSTHFTNAPTQPAMRRIGVHARMPDHRDRELRRGDGAAMTASLVLAIVAIPRRDFIAHGEWMTRAYAIGMGAGTQVLTHLPWFLLAGRPGETSRAILMGAGRVINVAVAEGIIHRRRARSARQAGRRARTRRRGGWKSPRDFDCRMRPDLPGTDVPVLIGHVRAPHRLASWPHGRPGSGRDDPRDRGATARCRRPEPTPRGRGVGR